MFEYTLQRKKRKMLAIKVLHDGSVLVLAPLFCPKNYIQDFVQKNEGWIATQQLKLKGKPALKKIEIYDGATIPLFGNNYTVRFYDRKRPLLTGDELYVSPQFSIENLKKFYSVQLREKITPYIAYYTEEMNVTPSRISVTSAKTRWGSCSGKNSIAFSFKLAMCNVGAVEYVVVHELCHILHKNHSENFWTEVEKHYPDYKKAKNYLKRNSSFMEII